jgi:hypothetical protein
MPQRVSPALHQSAPTPGAASRIASRGRYVSFGLVFVATATNDLDRTDAAST